MLLPRSQCLRADIKYRNQNFHSQILFEQKSEFSIVHSYEFRYNDNYVSAPKTILHFTENKSKQGKRKSPVTCHASQHKTQKQEHATFDHEITTKLFMYIDLPAVCVAFNGF